MVEMYEFVEMAEMVNLFELVKLFKLVALVGCIDLIEFYKLTELVRLVEMVESRHEKRLFLSGNPILAKMKCPNHLFGKFSRLRAVRVQIRVFRA